MNRRSIKKLIIFGAVFIVTAILTIIIINVRSSRDVSYTVSPSPKLPVLTLEAEGVSINTLYGYVERSNTDEAYEALTPLSANHKLKVSIKTYDENITAMSYEIRSMDGNDLIENTTVTEWEESEDTASGTFAIKDILEDGVEYRLNIKLSTEETENISYYTRVVYSENYKVKEMMEYVSDFHASTFNASDAEKYAINWEVDGSMDSETLAHVNIHSTFDQLTYSKLAPKQVGDPLVTVLEMDNNFGSFLVRFVLEATDERGENTKYYAEEFFCVQWSELRFYLMSYERYMTQIFEANTSTISDGEIDFGVADKSNIVIKKSPEEKYTSFVSCGDLWTYSAEESEITEVYSGAENRDTVYRAKRDYDIKVVKVDDEGNTSFIVYGYMNSGSHEGKNGLSYIVYNKSKNVLTELLFINTDHDYETIGADLDKLLVSSSEMTYFLCDDAVFEVDESSSESVCLVEGAAAHGLKTSEEGIGIAWAEGTNLDYPRQIQVKYLLTGKTNSITALEGEYVRPVGFSEEDFVYTRGRESDEKIHGLYRISPQYMLSIVDSEGVEIVHYEKTGVLIKSAKTIEGQIVINRVETYGNGYKDIDEDTLIQNTNVIEEEKNPFTEKTVNIRGKILTMSFNNAGSSTRFRVASPEQISYYSGELKTQTKDERILYFAYALGHLDSVCEEANEAIFAAYDDMGYVSASNSFRIWHRKAKDVVEYSIRIPEITSDGSNAMEGDLEAMITLAGGKADVKGMLSEGHSAREILESTGIGLTLNLENCTLKQIYLYLEKGFPVLALDEEGSPYLLVGYDKYNVIAYNPVTQDNYYIGENDAKAMLEEPSSRMIAMIW